MTVRAFKSSLAYGECSVGRDRVLSMQMASLVVFFFCLFVLFPVGFYVQ